MSTILFLHLFAIAFWFGVVAVEAIVERQRTRSRELGYAVARYHYQIDLFLEVPVFIVVLASGFMMLDSSRLSGVYLLKIVCGLLAIGMNTFCVIPVVLRKRAADGNRLEDVIRYSRWIDLTVPIGLPAALIALGIGLHWLLK